MNAVTVCETMGHKAVRTGYGADEANMIWGPWTCSNCGVALDMPVDIPVVLSDTAVNLVAQDISEDKGGQE